MSLTAHLEDLRKRLIVSVSSLLVTFVVAFEYSEELFRLLMFPL